MVGELDTSALSPGATKTLRDLNVEGALENQKIDAGNVANASAKNIYATQVISAATATGDQGTYDGAKQHLAQMGIDVSNWHPDVGVAQQQAAAARLAQSPLGSLLSTATKMDSNQIGANTAAGKATPDANATTHSILRGAMVQAYGPGAATVYDEKIAPQLNLAQETTNPGMNLGGQPPAKVSAMPANQASAAPVPVDAASASSLPSAEGVQPRQETAIDDRGSTPDNFVPPPLDQSKTAEENQRTYTRAFDAWQSSAAVKREAAKQEALGTAGAKTKEAASSSEEAASLVEQNINGIIGLAQKGTLPEGETANLSSKAYNLISPKSATAEDSKTFATLNEAQTIGAIRELADTGQIKMSRTLENIINKGYLVDPTASNAEKERQANIILNELKNSSIAAKNVDANINGGQKQPYVPMDIGGAGAADGWSYGGVKK